MPASWDNSKDSPSAFDAVSSFSGGQVSNSSPRLLSPDQWVMLNDVDITTAGQVSTRFGTTQIGANLGGGPIGALAYIKTPTVDTVIAYRTGGGIYYLSGSTWNLITNIGAADQPSIVQGSNLAYAAAGGNIYSWDGTTAVALSSDTLTAAPRYASILLWHSNRLMAAGPLIKEVSTDTAPVADAIYFSNILDASKWGTANKHEAQIRVGGGDGTGITALVPWTGSNVAVFKRESVWVINDDPQLTISQIPIQLVHSAVGCVARQTAVQVGADILFLADDGIRSLQQVVGSDQQHELGLPLSFQVQDIINRINWTYAYLSTAVFWRNLYMISLPLDTSTSNNYMLVFNTVTKTWEGLWTNLPASCFTSRLVGNVPHLMIGLTTSGIVDYLDYVNPTDWTDSTFTDWNATAVNPQLLTRSMTFNDTLSPKIGIGGEIEWNKSVGAVTITPILDEVAQTPFTINLPYDGFAIPFVLPFMIAAAGTGRASFDLMQYGEFRELQFLIQGTGLGRKELRQLALNAIVRPSLVGQS